VGNAKGMTSEVLIRFHKPVVDTSFAVDSARIELNYSSAIGDGDIVSWECQRINHDMTGPPPGPDDIPTGTPLEIVMEESAPDSGTVTVTLDAGEVTEWLLPDSVEVDTTVHDPGSAFNPDGTDLSVMTIRITAPYAFDKLIRFHTGASDSLRPRLHIFSTNSDTADNAIVDTISVVPLAKISLIENSEVVGGDRIVIGDGAIILSQLRFDISELIEMLETSHIIVNRAVITLHRDRALYTWGTRKAAVSLRAQKLTDDKWLTDPVGWVESPAFSGYPFNTATIDSSEDQIEFVVTDPSMQWIETRKWDEDSLEWVDADNNFGVLIQPYSSLFHPFRKGIDIERIAFHSIDDPDPALRPTLTVHYTEFIK